MAKAMTRIGVDTWLDAPTDKVTSSHIQVQITNSNYQKLAN